MKEPEHELRLAYNTGLLDGMMIAMHLLETCCGEHEHECTPLASLDGITKAMALDRASLLFHVITDVPEEALRPTEKLVDNL